jgi:hypothetical protein
MKTKHDPEGAAGLPPRSRGRSKPTSFRALAPLVAAIAGIPGFAAADPIVPARFPLAPGDVWTYESTSGQTANVLTAEQFTFHDQTVYRMVGYLFNFSNADVLFFDEDGMTKELNPELVIPGGDLPRGHATVPLLAGIWYPWSKPEQGVEIPRYGSDCIHGSTGHIAGGKTVKVQAGVFQNAIEIVYDRQPCADHCVMAETFVPGIGLVERRVSTFVGEVRWGLSAAIVGGQQIGIPTQPAERLASGRDLATAPPLREGTWGAIKAAFAR